MAETDPPTGGKGFAKRVGGLPLGYWAAGIGVIGGALYFWYRSRKTASAATPAVGTAAASTTDQTAGMATDQYESILALLRDVQGQESNEPPPLPGPPGPAGPPGASGAPGQPPVILPIQGGNPPRGVGGPASPAPAPTPPVNMPPPAAQRSYVVKPGDSMIGIASRLGFPATVAGATQLYNLDGNAQEIRTTAQQHGYHSDYIHWIFPDEVLHY